MYDGDGAPIVDCMLEIWQADSQGRFSDPQDKCALPNTSFKRFGRVGTDAKGGYAFDTIKLAWCLIPTANRRRHTSCSRCLRAACCCTSTPGTSRTRRPTPMWQNRRGRPPYPNRSPSRTPTGLIRSPRTIST